MVYLTYYYDRDIFNKNEFSHWIKKLFKKGEVTYMGGSSSRRFPEISISDELYEKTKNKIKTKNLVKITKPFKDSFITAEIENYWDEDVDVRYFIGEGESQFLNIRDNEFSGLIDFVENK